VLPTELCGLGADSMAPLAGKACVYHLPEAIDTLAKRLLTG
jgi:hypothetical protein